MSHQLFCGFHITWCQFWFQFHMSVQLQTTESALKSSSLIPERARYDWFNLMQSTIVRRGAHSVQVCLFLAVRQDPREEDEGHEKPLQHRKICILSRKCLWFPPKIEANYIFQNSVRGIGRSIVSFLTCLFCLPLAFTSRKQSGSPKYKKNLLENLKLSKILSADLFYVSIRKNFLKIILFQRPNTFGWLIDSHRSIELDNKSKSNIFISPRRS